MGFSEVSMVKEILGRSIQKLWMTQDPIAVGFYLYIA